MTRENHLLPATGAGRVGIDEFEHADRDEEEDRADAGDADQADRDDAAQS